MLACFLATMTIYMERVGFSIAFTAMASKVTPQQSRGSDDTRLPLGQAAGQLAGSHSLAPTHVPLSPAVQVGVEEGIKGAVLSAFYWGYAISQVMRCAGSIAQCLPPLCPSSTPLHVPQLRSSRLLCASKRDICPDCPAKLPRASFVHFAGAGRLGSAALWRRACAQLVVCAVVGCCPADPRLGRQRKADGGSASGRRSLPGVTLGLLWDLCCTDLQAAALLASRGVRHASAQFQPCCSFGTAICLSPVLVAGARWPARLS